MTIAMVRQQLDHEENDVMCILKDTTSIFQYGASNSHPSARVASHRDYVIALKFVKESLINVNGDEPVIAFDVGRRGGEIQLRSIIVINAME